jgi:hypothetical protein
MLFFQMVKGYEEAFGRGWGVAGETRGALRISTTRYRITI